MMRIEHRGSAMHDVTMSGAKSIIDSLSEGIYVCDLDRTITYWSQSAEQITGWSAAEVIGRQCHDSVLCHVDKDGHLLCGEEYCPLHRAMVTGTRSRGSLLVYAQKKGGRRVPVEVSVAPIRDKAGTVIGGVETFRDATGIVHDLERAKAIQRFALQYELPADDRVTFTTHYVPHDIIGGDYFAIERLDADRYGIMLADVMGHGIAAALYTMHLSQLWDRFHTALTDPVEFTSTVNNALAKVLKSDVSFATAVCALVDVKNRVFRFVGAGGPTVLLMHADGSREVLKNPGLPLGILVDAPYEEIGANLREGDRLLLFSDGAVEVANAAGEMVGLDGLVVLLQELGYPGTELRMDALEEALLRFSNAIRLPDDLTLIEVRMSGS
jgi:PAS domain S-box-containing protein